MRKRNRPAAHLRNHLFTMYGKAQMRAVLQDPQFHSATTAVGTMDVGLGNAHMQSFSMDTCSLELHFITDSLRSRVRGISSACGWRVRSLGTLSRKRRGQVEYCTVEHLEMA